MALVMVGFAVNVLLGLWTRSTVDSVAYDAARAIATAPAGTPRSVAAAQAFGHARSMLGPTGERIHLSLETADDPEVVVVRLKAPGVRLMPAMLGAGPIVGDVDRRIVVRAENP